MQILDALRYGEDVLDTRAGLNSLWTSVIFCAISFTCALAPTRANRGRVVRWLGALGKHGNEQQRAAAVAGLCGGGEPSAILVKAISLFRMIPVARLTSDDLAGSGVTTHGSSATPSSNPGTSALELAKKTEAATLGEVDAFLSHSWRDEDAAPGQKYAALEAWAARFEAAHGRGPTCWLDKACIKQDSIDEALACLPVFLAGCERMLVIAGKTYTTRLWCAAVCPHGR